MLKLAALLVVLAGIYSYAVLPYTLLVNFIALEYIFLGAGIYGVSFALEQDDFEGQIYLLLVLAVGAAEAALGLALLVQFYRLRGNVQILVYPYLKA